MKKIFNHYINYLAVMIAITSLIVGTICLLLFKTSSDNGLFGIGFWITFTAGLINSIMLILVAAHGIYHFKDYKEHIKTLFVVLANIPIAYLYVGFAIL